MRYKISTIRKFSLYKNLLRLLSIFILLSLVGYSAAALTSLHVHILPDGRAVFHSHPSGNEHSENPENKQHSHTNSEYLFINHYTSLLNNAIIIIVIFCFFYAVFITFSAERKLSLISNTYNLHLLRAPPNYLI